MSVLKIAGLICMIAGGAGVGYSMSVQVGRRYEQLCELSRMAALLMGEISYTNAPISEALEQVSMRVAEPFSSFLDNLARRLKELPQETMSDLFRQSVQEFLKNGVLKENDLEMICRMGEHLGYLDRQMQLKTLDMFEQELKLEQKTVYDTMERRCKVYRSLGIMGGIFLAILFI